MGKGMRGGSAMGGWGGGGTTGRVFAIAGCSLLPPVFKN